MSDHTTSIFGSSENLQQLCELHRQLLQAIGEYPKLDRLRGQVWTTFMPRRGLQGTDSGLMIFGRAVNGWLDPITLDSIATPANRELVIEALLKEFCDEKCPMSWIEKPQKWNWKRSAFTRLMHQLTVKLLPESDAPWHSRIIWSNLYKVAPYDGGNPSNRLCSAQEQACLRYFAKELEIWRPRRVVLVTGWNWAQPFVNQFAEHAPLPTTPPKLDAKKLVDWSGLVYLTRGSAGIPLVVCKRPEYRRGEDLVREISEAFEQLAT